MVNQTPSMRPADESSLAGVMKTAIRKELQNLNVMLPVEVVGYDRATNRATIKHLVQMEGANGEKVSRANVASIRVLQPGNGGFQHFVADQTRGQGLVDGGRSGYFGFSAGAFRRRSKTRRACIRFRTGFSCPTPWPTATRPRGKATAW
jgi:hypothetical protein